MEHRPLPALILGGHASALPVGEILSEMLNEVIKEHPPSVGGADRLIALLQKAICDCAFDARLDVSQC
jgi:hypothetical protein